MNTLGRTRRLKSKEINTKSNLQVLSEQLKQEPQVDLDQLYEEDPAEYVRVKAEQDRRKELLQALYQEQERLQAEKQELRMIKNINTYLAEQRQLLTQKLPIYADKEKGPEFVKELNKLC